MPWIFNLYSFLDTCPELNKEVFFFTLRMRLPSLAVSFSTWTSKIVDLQRRKRNGGGRHILFVLSWLLVIYFSISSLSFRGKDCSISISIFFYFVEIIFEGELVKSERLSQNGSFYETLSANKNKASVYAYTRKDNYAHVYKQAFSLNLKRTHVLWEKMLGYKKIIM